MLFNDIIGLDTTKKHLISSIKNEHVAHAQMFAGPPGSANLTMALAYATYINCENPGEEDACGACNSCLKMRKLIHPDLHFVFPISPVKGIAGKDVVCDNYIESWRKFLLQNPYGSPNDWSHFFGGENKQMNIYREESRQIIKKLSLKPSEGGYKILLMWMPEFLNQATANSLLKVLEEPPEKTLFILVANDVERILPTIISRVQVVHIPKFTPESLKWLIQAKQTEGIVDQNIDEQQIDHIARLADGNFQEALQMINHTQDDIHSTFADWMRLCYSHNWGELTDWTDTFHQMGREEQKNLLLYGLNMMREALIHQTESHEESQEVAAAEKLGRLTGSTKDFITKFSKVLTLDKIENIHSILNDAHYHIERNANPKITFLDISIKIGKTLKPGK